MTRLGSRGLRCVFIGSSLSGSSVPCFFQIQRSRTHSAQQDVCFVARICDDSRSACNERAAFAIKAPTHVLTRTQAAASLHARLRASCFVCSKVRCVQLPFVEHCVPRPLTLLGAWQEVALCPCEEGCVLRHVLCLMFVWWC